MKRPTASAATPGVRPNLCLQDCASSMRLDKNISILTEEVTYMPTPLLSGVMLRVSAFWADRFLIVGVPVLFMFVLMKLRGRKPAMKGQRDNGERNHATQYEYPFSSFPFPFLFSINQGNKRQKKK